MTGIELIKLIERAGISDFEIKISLLEADNSEYGIKLRKFDIDNKICDIGYSDKVVLLSIIEQ